MDGTIGQVMIWAGNAIPMHWLLCDGRLLSIKANESLFNIIGNLYGGSKAQGTFALPDFRDVFVKGAGKTGAVGDRNENSSSALKGRATGKFSLEIDHLPPHSHTGVFTQNTSGAANSIEIAIPVDESINAGVTTPTQLSSLGKGNTLTNAAIKMYSNNPTTSTLKPFTVNLPQVTGSIQTDLIGSGKPVDLNIEVSGQTEVTPPWIAMNFIICVDGMYPQTQ